MAAMKQFSPLIRAFLLCPILVIRAVAAGRAPSDAEIRDALLRDSQAQSLSDCPCPYSLKRNGAPCGEDSAYAKPRGRQVYCYDHDVTDAMIRAYRVQHGLPAR